MFRILHRTAELCFDLETARSVAQVRDVLKRASAMFGASYFFVVMRSGRKVVPPVQLVLTTYPARFQRYFDEHRAVEYDPVVVRAAKAADAFRWDGLYHTEQEKALHQHCVECGMEFGFSCSDRGPHGSWVLMCFCGSEPIAPAPTRWAHTAAASLMLAASTHRVLRRVARHRAQTAPAKSLLSATELRALEMTARAMTAAQISKALGVKAGTVRYYLDRAAEKLGVESRREAVSKALAQGLIDTRVFPAVGFSGSALDFDQ